MANGTNQSVTEFFLRGDNFTAETPWRPGLAVLASIGFFFFQGIVAVIVFFIMLAGKLPADQMADIGRLMSSQAFADAMNVAVLACEALGFLMVLLVAERFGGDAGKVLLLKTPKQPGLSALFAVVSILAFFVFLSVVVSAVFPKDAMQGEEQMRQIFSALSNSKYLWAGAVAISIGAPFFEESIFRGFLLTAFARTRLGFSGAAVLTSLLWAVMHAGYSLVMIAGLFALGMVLSAAVRRSGSIWPAIAMHGLWNSFVTWSTLQALSQAGAS
ncbi:MAG TPA: CPBP family intramembrane metalloprotease [Rhizobiales bacterium]|nr:CPBP family intramembrane metalloprotease [Hyphomicrobiales bacterium]